VSVTPARPRASIVVPVYRNASSLRELAERVTAALVPDWSEFELLLVDDGSPDDAWSVIGELAAHDSRIKGIRLSRNFGQHPAIAAGFDVARGNRIIIMDADLQDRPEELPRLLSGLNDEVDIVYTIKQGGEGSVTEKITSRIFHTVFSSVTRRKVPYGIGTYRAFSSKVLNSLRAYPEYNVLFGPLMFYVGFSSTYIEVTRDSRKHGTTSYSFLNRLSLAFRSLASYTDLPNRLFFAAGMFVLTLTVLYSLAIVIQYMVFGKVLPSGLTLLALLILFHLAVMLIGLGIIGSYVFRVYQEVLRRPRYLVAQTLNLVPGVRTET
jgi:glycosyltransferase involved in cell wall biosynthesis